MMIFLKKKKQGLFFVCKRINFILNGRFHVQTHVIGCVSYTLLYFRSSVTECSIRLRRRDDGAEDVQPYGAVSFQSLSLSVRFLPTVAGLFVL